LLEELLARIEPAALNPGKVEKLKSLQADCAQENVSARPLFTEIVSRLGALKLA